MNGMKTEGMKQAAAGVAAAEMTVPARTGADISDDAKAVILLPMYEARIRLYKEQAVTGYIGIGRTLNEAKAAGVVPHGEWESWVEGVTGLSIRQAQKCMRAAAEIREGSFLGTLDLSKATALLSSGLDEDEREYLGERAVEDGATLQELRKEIKALKVAKVSDAGMMAELKGELKKAQGERDQIKAQMQALHRGFDERAEQIRQAAYETGKQDGGTELGRENVILEDRLRKLEEQRQEAEIRVAEAERKLEKQIREAEKKIRETERAVKATAEEEARTEIRKEFQGKLDFLHGELRQAREAEEDSRAAAEDAAKKLSAKWNEGFAAGQQGLSDEARAKIEAETRRKVAEEYVQQRARLRDEARKAAEAELQGKLDAADAEIRALREEAKRTALVMSETEEERRDVLSRRIRELEGELEAAENREAKRAKELAELRKAKAQAGMDAARGIRAETAGALDLAAAVRSFIGAAGVLPQMGQAIAGMSESERDGIRAQVETVAEWVRASRAALGTIQAEASIQ